MAIVTAPLLALALAAAKPAPKPQAPPPAASASNGTQRGPESAATPARLPAILSGSVTDATTGEAVGGALVQQSGAVTSIFTDAQGHFRLLLERNGGATFTVSAVGYEDQKVAVGDGKDRGVKLRTVSGFLPAPPLAPNVPIGMSNAETAPLNSGLIFNYALRNNTITAPGASGQDGTVTGLSNNDFRLGFRFRYKPWLLEADGSHFENPIDLPDLQKADNPAFKPSTYQVGARLGALYALNSDLEVAGLLAYRWSNTVPNNSRVPFTGTGIDFEQTRHAVGAEGLLAWRPGRGHWHLEVGGGYYPFLYATADSPGTPFASANLLDGHAILGYEVFTGFRLGVGAVYERYSGNGSDQALKGTLGIHYTPGGVPKGNE